MINSACKERIYALKNKIISDFIQILFAKPTNNQCSPIESIQRDSIFYRF